MNSSKNNLERDVLYALSMDYVSVYHINLNTDQYSILRTTTDLREDVYNMVASETSFSQQILQYIHTFVLEEDQKRIYEVTRKEYILEKFSEKKVYDVRYQTKPVGGKSIWFEMHFVDVSENAEEPHLVLAWRCVDEVMKREMRYQHQLEEALANTNVMFREIIEMQSTGIIAIAAGEKKVRVMNAAALNLYGWSSVDEFDGEWRAIAEKTLASDTDSLLHRFYNMKSGESFSFEFSIRKKDDRKLRVFAQCRKISLENQEELILITLTDISYKVEVEKELLALSSVDKLTGILNRASGEHKIDAFLQSGRAGMFCLLDVDKFKGINDNYGHMVGDDALKAVADCMRSSFRENDVVMRLGGDEFVVFVAGEVNEQKGSEYLNRFMKKIKDIRVGPNGEVRVSLSIGAVLCGSGEALSFDELYKRADSAMYKNKRKKR